PRTSCTDRFIFPSASGNARRLATLSASQATSVAVSVGATPSSTSHPAATSPVTSPPTVTFARRTRCKTARIGRNREESGRGAGRSRRVRGGAVGGQCRAFESAGGRTRVDPRPRTGSPEPIGPHTRGAAAMGMDDYTRHQQKIIKRYYENIDQIALQRLAEL